MDTNCAQADTQTHSGNSDIGTEHPIIDSAVVDRHEAMLLRYARSRVATDDIAKELVQDTWVAALAALPRFAGRSTMSTWLTSILRRKIADVYRRRKDTVSYHEALDSSLQHSPPQGVAFLQQVMARESAARVFEAMSGLTPREREAVELCGVGDVDRDEAAMKMGLTRRCLRVTLCRGRRHLRELVGVA